MPTQQSPPMAFIYDRRTTPTKGIMVMRLQACHGHAEERGYEIAGEWYDEGDGALVDRRPQFSQLIARMRDASQCGRQAVCLVNDFDRLSHDSELRRQFIRRVHLAGGWVEDILGDRSDQRTGRLTGMPLT